MLAIFLCTFCNSEDRAHAQVGNTGKRWIDMDYGPYMTHSFEASRPKGNIAYKGLKIRLGDGGQAMLFDTDLLRWAAGWQSSDLDWRSVVYDGSHNTHPHVLGEPVFANPVAPGWASDGKFDDPRELPYGPLPRDWAHFKGLHLHNQSVVLSYSVGDADVLESPAQLSAGDTSALVRKLQIGKSSHDLTLQVAIDGNNKLQLVNSSDGSATKSSGIDESIALFGSIQDPSSETEQTATEGLQVTKGLLAHWSFDEEDSTSYANSVAKTYAAAINGNVKSVDGAQGGGLQFPGKGHVAIADGEKLRLDAGDWTIAAWIKTTRGGTILARGPAKGEWQPKGKSFFVRGGKLCFDIGWVGVVRSNISVADGKWHHVAVVSEKKTERKTLFVDGAAAGQKELASEDDPEHVVRIGYTATDFVPEFQGSMDDVRIYSRAVSADELRQLAGAEVTTSEQIAAVACAASSANVSWVTSDDGNLRLHIPAASTPVRITIAHWRGSSREFADFQTAANKLEPTEDLTPLTKGGPARWREEVTTQIETGKAEGPFAKDEFILPRNNPWKSWMRIGGFDFFADGKRAAVGTWSGDVWIVSGIDAQQGELKWRRIATGLFQPLGVKIVDEEIFVTCRDAIVRLHDLNNDEEIDYYEQFNNDHQVTEHFHEFAMDLQTDAEGNFYYAKSARHAKTPLVPHHGTLIKVSADGKTSEIVCNGFRAANGVGIGPDGEMWTSDQEGHWTPANRINLVKKGGFYGNMWSYHLNEEPSGYDPPVVWLPKNVDRSPAAQLYVPKDAWGPLGGKLIHTSYGTGWLWNVMYEYVDGVPQGAVARLPVQFPTGIMRGRFHPGNKQLYACGLVGWSSSQPIDGGFYRVRYLDKPLHLPVAMHVKKDGIELTFSEKLDPKSAADYENWAVEQWNYKWTGNYGSAHYSVENERRKGQDEVDVWDVTLSDDGKTVFLEIEDLQPVMQMQIRYNIQSADGAELEDSVWLTINNVPHGS